MMMDITQNSTIAAIATPSGTGGIGIIKISGPCSFNIIKKIFVSRHTHPLKDLQPRKIYYGDILHPETKQVIDEVIMFGMKGPASYTAEDVVEIQAHGGLAILRTILDIVLEQGAELAAPGEFTKRAFLNGRLDLAQAESVIDVINSQTATSLNLSISQLKGTVSDFVKKIRNILVNILTEMEAAIDFPDEVEDNINLTDVYDILENEIEIPLMSVISDYEKFHILRDGIKVAIIGAPNVGKSSLLNCLVEKEKAIVTPLPGTTRDVIEDCIFLQGHPVLISDTAGIHQTDDIVENIGIQKADDYIKSANIILFVIDVNRNISDNELNIYEKIKDKNYIIVLNKTDLSPGFNYTNLGRFEYYIDTVEISAKYNKGIDKIKSVISQFFFKRDLNIENRIIPNLRQKKSLNRVLDHICSAKKAISEYQPYEIIAIDIKEAIVMLGDITGETANFDILDSIFNNFCIGK